MSGLTEKWRVMDLDGDYHIDDLHVLANAGDPVARQTLNFIGRLRYRDALFDDEDRPYLSDSPDQFTTAAGIKEDGTLRWFWDLENI